MNIINILMLICIIYISLAVFYLILLSDKVSKYTVLKVENQICKSKRGVEFYENLDLKLRKNGMKFRFKEITPVKYILFYIIFGMGVFLFLWATANLEIGFIGAIIAILFISIIIKYQNKYDNKKMLKDLKILFSSIKTQMKAGSYLSEALREGYLVVANKRLKQALLELNNDILIDKNLDETLTKFKNKFSNNQIDTFCILLSQASKSGQTLQMLDDLNIKIKDIQKILRMDTKNNIKKKISLYQILMFIGIIIIIFVIIGYSIDTSLTGADIKF